MLWRDLSMRGRCHTSYGWTCACVAVYCTRHLQVILMYTIVLVPYSTKVSPGENFGLFRPGTLWEKFFRRIIFFVTLQVLHLDTQFYTWLPSSPNRASWLSAVFNHSKMFSVLICILAWCNCSRTLAMDFARFRWTSIVWAIAFNHRRGQRCCERHTAS